MTASWRSCPAGQMTNSFSKTRVFLRGTKRCRLFAVHRHYEAQEKSWWTCEEVQAARHRRCQQAGRPRPLFQHHGALWQRALGCPGRLYAVHNPEERGQDPPKIQFNKECFTATHQAFRDRAGTWFLRSVSCQINLKYMGSLLSWDDFCFLQVRNTVEKIQAWLPLSKQMLYGTARPQVWRA